jgi:hypothetical protein
MKISMKSGWPDKVFGSAITTDGMACHGRADVIEHYLQTVLVECSTIEQWLVDSPDAIGNGNLARVPCTVSVTSTCSRTNIAAASVHPEARSVRTRLWR